MSLANTDHAAGILADLRLKLPGAVPIDELPLSCRPQSLFEAYEIQNRLRELLAFRRPGKQVGWRIGCTTPVMRDYLKIPHPCAGTLYENTVFREHAVLQAENHYRLGVECEIAVQLSHDLPISGGPYRRETVQPAVGAVMATIGIVDQRFTDFRKASTPSLIADDFFAVGCVLGARIPFDEVGSLAALRGGVAIDGKAQEPVGSGIDVLGHPLTALAWLADNCAGLGMPLRAGQIVSLGSMVKTIYPKPGAQIETQFDQLPPASVSIV